MRYGSLDFTNEVIGDFEGDLDLAEVFFEKLFMRKLNSHEHNHEQVVVSDKSKHISTIDVRDAKMHHLYAKVSTTGNHKAHIDLSTEINHRMRTDHVFEEFREMSASNGDETAYAPKDFDCLRMLVDTYEQECGRFDDYSLKYVKYLVNECETLPAIGAIEFSIDKLKKVCSH